MYFQTTYYSPVVATARRRSAGPLNPRFAPARGLPSEQKMYYNFSTAASGSAKSGFFLRYKAD
jgi:hypothetical protein